MAGSQAKPHQKLLMPHVDISDEYLITRKGNLEDSKWKTVRNVQRRILVQDLV